MSAFANYLVSAVCLSVLIPVLAKLVNSFKSFLKKRALYMQFPQDPANKIFGHALTHPGTTAKGLEYQKEMAEKYPKCSLLWLMQIPMIMAHHPDTAKVVLKSSEPKGEILYNMLRPWIGEGLLISKGQKWARNRQLLTPAFHFEILKTYLEVKNRCADQLLKKLERAAKECQPFSVFSNLTRFTLDVILRCLMSYETECQKLESGPPYVTAVDEISEYTAGRFFKPWLYNNFIYFLTPAGWQYRKNCNLVHKVSEEIINKRRETLKTQGLPAVNGADKRHLDFIDILLAAKDESGIGLTNREIRDEVDTFLLEGHDTTASAISWALYSIAGHQDIQKRIQEELDDRMAGRKNDDILWEDLAELPYLAMVIKEALRLHSPVPYIQRELTVDTEINGTIAPAGTMVTVPLYNVHHNPAVWEDPSKFDPDRFLPENIEKRSAHAFVPFSAGPRNCIGQNFAMQEIKIALARILHRFNIKLDPTSKVTKSPCIVMRPQGDMRILVTERSTLK